MTKSTRSYQGIFEFMTLATQWLGKNENGNEKFRYALTKTVRKLNKLRERYQEEVEEINIEHCATDKEGVILRDEQGQYKYVKDELIKRNKKVSELYRDSSIEVEGYFAAEVPDNLNEVEKEVFTGFVLKPEESEG